MVDIEDLVKAVVARQIFLGRSSSEAHSYALGYLVSFVNGNLIDTAPPDRQKLIAAAISKRVQTIEGYKA